jgi:hypothetical protein
VLRIRSPFHRHRSPFHSVTGIMPKPVVRDRATIPRGRQSKGDSREIPKVVKVGFNYFSCQNPPLSDTGISIPYTGIFLQTYT